MTRALVMANVAARIARGEHPEDAMRKVWKSMIADEHAPVVADRPEPQPIRTFKPIAPANRNRNERARKLRTAIAEMTAAGEKADFIAYRLGCSLSSVERHRSSLRRAAMPKAGPERDAAIMSMHADHKSTREIAKAVGVTLDIVRWTFDRMGVKPHFTPTIRRKFADDVTRAAKRRPDVAALRASGLSQPKIALSLGISESTVKADFAWMASEAKKAGMTSNDWLMMWLGGMR